MIDKHQLEISELLWLYYELENTEFFLN